VDRICNQIVRLLIIMSGNAAGVGRWPLDRRAGRAFPQGTPAAAPNHQPTDTETNRKSS
jgi:hypothetical protein